MSSVSDPQVPAPEQEENFTLQEVLENEEELQADAEAVLGASDEKNCSYPMGYQTRQALYACKTCTPTELAAICLACSYHCHEGHELFELYTKRNFRCDCGNEKFKDKKCTLFEKKSPLNERNLYNHNFEGRYCHCDRPYPDPENTGDDSMFQCVICEDWFHLEHVGLSESSSKENFEEICCDTCMKDHPFLWRYHTLEPSDEKSKAKEVDVEAVDEEGKIQAAKKMKLEKPCKFASLHVPETIPTSGAVWSNSWREMLCDCESCHEMYESQQIPFLSNTADTLAAYFEEGKTKLKKKGDPLMNELNKLGHVQKLDIINGYNNLKNSLKDFLQKQAGEKKVVTAEDIHKFFEKMPNTKSHP